MRRKTIVDSWGNNRRYFFACSHGFKCDACESDLQINKYGNRSIVVFEIDHALALQFGGLDSLENLNAICPNCHRNKTQHENVTKLPYCIICQTTYSRFFRHRCHDKPYGGPLWYSRRRSKKHVPCCDLGREKKPQHASTC